MFVIVRNEIFCGNRGKGITRENKSVVPVEPIDMVRTSSDLKITHLERK